MSGKSDLKAREKIERFLLKSGLSFLTPEERMEGLSFKEILEGLDEDAVVSVILSVVDHQVILSMIPVDEIEAHLQKLKEQSQ